MIIEYDMGKMTEKDVDRVMLHVDFKKESRSIKPSKKDMTLRFED